MSTTLYQTVQKHLKQMLEHEREMELLTQQIKADLKTADHIAEDGLFESRNRLLYLLAKKAVTKEQHMLIINYYQKITH